MGRAERDLAEPWIRALTAEISNGDQGAIDEVLIDIHEASQRAARSGIRAMELQIDVLHEISAAVQAIEHPDSPRILEELERYQADLFEPLARDRKQELALRKRTRQRGQLLHVPAPIRAPPFGNAC